MKVMLENKYVPNIINTPSHPMLVKPHKFVKQVNTFILFLFFSFHIVIFYIVVVEG